MWERGGVGKAAAAAADTLREAFPLPPPRPVPQEFTTIVKASAPPPPPSLVQTSPPPPPRAASTATAPVAPTPLSPPPPRHFGLREGERLCETGNAIKVQKVQETTSQCQSTLSSSSASTSSSKGARQKSYCWCRGADDGNMVGCDGCFDWFHADCIETRMGLG